MRYFLLLFLLVSSNAYAQCVGEVKAVMIDEMRGSIIVQTQYKLNGLVVDVDTSACYEKDGGYFLTKVNPQTNQSYVKECLGQTRYTEESGTAEVIRLKVKDDIEQHCSNLIARIPANRETITAEMIKIATEKTEPIKELLEDVIIGDKYTVTKTVQTFKDKTIEVTADGQKTVTAIDISPVVK